MSIPLILHGCFHVFWAFDVACEQLLDNMLVFPHQLSIWWYYGYLPGIILLFILHLIMDCFSSIFKISYCYFHVIWSSDAVTASSEDHIIVLRIICTYDRVMNILLRSHCHYCVICAQSAVYEHLQIGSPSFRHGMPFWGIFLISQWGFASFDHIMLLRACPWYHNVARAI